MRIKKRSLIFACITLVALIGLRGIDYFVSSGNNSSIYLPIVLNGPSLPSFSSGQLNLIDGSENAFNNLHADYTFQAVDTFLSTNEDDFFIMYNGFITDIDEFDIDISPTEITFHGLWYDWINQLTFFTLDYEGKIIGTNVILWAGEQSLEVNLIDENGQPVNANVTLKLANNLNISATQTSMNGGVTFDYLPSETVIIEAITSDNRFTTLTAFPDPEFSSITIQIPDNTLPSEIDNNDFSQGTAGWVIGSAPVSLIPHVENPGPQTGTNVFVSPDGIPLQRNAQTISYVENATTQNSLDLISSNVDLSLNTLGEEPQSISRAFSTHVGVTSVLIRYRFETDEVPGGYFGSQFDDYFSIVIHSQQNGTFYKEENSMNGLGISAFDANGSTAWREVTMSVDSDGDIIQIDLTVSNVEDPNLDSRLIVDEVIEVGCYEGSFDPATECCGINGPFPQVNGECPLCGNTQYDPSNQCCYADNIVDKFTIYDLDACPNRVARPNYFPSYNGCGSKGGIRFPDSPSGADFSIACNYHDICYGFCNKDKSFCDSLFYHEMIAACTEKHAGNSEALEKCGTAAALYYLAVAEFGEFAYDDAQKEGCICCECTSLDTEPYIETINTTK